MKKVCLLIPTLNSGGIEMYVLRFLRFCEERKKDLCITIIVKNGHKDVLFDDYKNTNAKILFLKTGYFNIYSWIKVYRLFKNEGFSVICDFTANFAGIYMLLGKYARISKRIAFYRQASNLFKPNVINLFYNKIVNKLVYNNATRILANSNASLDYFFSYREAFDERFQVIYNGIDTRVFEKEYEKHLIRKEFDIPDNAIVVGHTGRYTWAKNFPVIIQVAERLYDNYNNVYFVCCGSDTDIELTKKITGKKQDRMRFLGYRKDVLRILSMFDIFFFPSLTESQPNSLLEALLAGLPIVASKIDPIKECLPKELHGQLIESGDVEGAYLKIEELIRDEEKRISLNRSKWAKETYNAEAKFEEFYNVLVNE